MTGWVAGPNPRCHAYQPADARLFLQTALNELESDCTSWLLHVRPLAQASRERVPVVTFFCCHGKSPYRIQPLELQPTILDHVQIELNAHQHPNHAQQACMHGWFVWIRVFTVTASITKLQAMLAAATTKGCAQLAHTAAAGRPTCQTAAS